MKRTTRESLRELLQTIAGIFIGLALIALALYSFYFVHHASETFLSFVCMSIAGICMFTISLDTLRAATSKQRSPSSKTALRKLIRVPEHTPGLQSED